MAVVGIAGLFASVSQARELLDAITTPWVDPWLTRPPVLDTGKVLPGDSDPPSCPDSTAWTVAGVTHPLTLSEAVDLALCHNPQVHSAWAAVKVQAVALGEARAAYLPTVSAGISRLTDHTRYPDSKVPSATLHSSTLSGNVQWRLFDFGGRGAKRDAANALLSAALASHDAVLQKTLTLVVTTYFDAQTAHALWLARQTNASLARQTLDTARRREAHSAGARSDTLQAVTALAKAELERSRAQGGYRKAIAALVHVLGLPSGAEPVLVEDLHDSTGRLQQELKVWLQQAQASHPAMLAARAHWEAARERVTVVRSEGLPSIEMTGNYFQNGRPNQGLSATRTQETLLGVTLNVPLFDGFAHTYKVRGAQAQVEQKETEWRDTEHQVLMEVVKAHADASAALENLTASRELLAAAQGAMETMRRRHDRGAADILEILNTQAALSDAQQERIRCMAEWRSSRLRLISTAGMLGTLQMEKNTDPHPD
ncbi:MAG: TolC family protein [Magnetococcus sp. MYC-9]